MNRHFRFKPLAFALAAADLLAAAGEGPVGMTAGELIPAARGTLNRLIATHA